MTLAKMMTNSVRAIPFPIKADRCTEIDEAARNRMELIVRSLAEQNGVT